MTHFKTPFKVQRKPLSVSDILKQIKNILEGKFSQVYVIGEISNISKSATGHIYFNISDAYSTMSCAFFKNDFLNATRIDSSLLKLKKGDRVLCSGPISLYLQKGSFQLIVKSIEIEGEGDLQKKFNDLKNRLRADGLFDLNSKLKIPLFAKKIAIITSLHGAALKDFINIYRRRSPWCDLLIISTLVQGDSAGRSIQNALITAIKYNLSSKNSKKIDVVVMTRGGGSEEDLWCFNDEALAWEVFNCPIPTISAVGHERDFTITDFVCDLRCETPSAAAEMLSQHGFTVQNKLSNIKSKLKHIMGHDLYRYKESLLKCRPDRLYYKLSENFKALNQMFLKFDRFKSPELIFELNSKMLHLESLFNSIDLEVKEQLKLNLNSLESKKELLAALNPISVLNRGYSLTLDSNGKIIKTIKEFNQVKHGNELQLKFSDGVGNVQKK